MGKGIELNEQEMKQLFDIIFMMVISFVMAISLLYGLYRGAIILWKQHRKGKVLKKIQHYVDMNQFKQVVSFDKEGIPILIEISDEKIKKIVAL